MRTIRVALLLLLAAVIAAAQTTSRWQLVWSDEFNGAAGTAPDPAKWNFDVGSGWGQYEIESNNSSANNVFLDGNGNLVLRVTKDAQGNYTSGRLQTGAPGASTHTADLSWQYGRIEARIKLPFGKGVWPAFWMLGENYATAGWPGCGEADIMENFGAYNNNASKNNGTIHGPGPGNSPSTPTDYPPYGGVGTSATLPFGETVYDDFHIYAIEWAQDSIEFFLDGVSYEKLTPASLPAGAKWVFNAPFFLILNVAIGSPGAFLGTPDASVTFPQTMLVDYVRVYKSTTVAATTPVIAPAGIVNAASYLGAISPGGLATVFGNDLADAEHIIPPPAATTTDPAS
ncbi:MAG: glycoside hydrolase family 16 protein [Bryobacteraceae bacterium]|jgi:beta-glucanase (GH16 family)